MNEKANPSNTDRFVSTSFSTHRRRPQAFEFVPVLHRTRSRSKIKDNLTATACDPSRTKSERDEPVDNRVDGNKPVISSNDGISHFLQPTTTSTTIAAVDYIATVGRCPDTTFSCSLETLQTHNVTLSTDKKQCLVSPMCITSPEQCSILSPDLFQPCTDKEDEVSFPVPSTRSIKESKRIARQKKLESVRRLEQSEQRKYRFLRRQKRLDADDGVPTVVASGTNTTNDFSSLRKSKKKVMWQDSSLFEFHIYSPVSVEERELTPVISTS